MFLELYEVDTLFCTLLKIHLLLSNPTAAPRPARVSPSPNSFLPFASPLVSFSFLPNSFPPNSPSRNPKDQSAKKDEPPRVAEPSLEDRAPGSFPYTRPYKLKWEGRHTGNKPRGIRTLGHQCCLCQRWCYHCIHPQGETGS